MTAKGGTLRSCAGILRAAVAREVYGYCLAHTEADLRIQQALWDGNHLRVNAATGYAAVLSRGYLGMAEVIGADPGRQCLLFD
jgi:hypothetical protein